MGNPGFSVNSPQLRQHKLFSHTKGQPTYFRFSNSCFTNWRRRLLSPPEHVNLILWQCSYAPAAINQINRSRSWCPQPSFPQLNSHHDRTAAQTWRLSGFELALHHCESPANGSGDEVRKLMRRSERCDYTYHSLTVMGSNSGHCVWVMHGWETNSGHLSLWRKNRGHISSQIHRNTGSYGRHL